jgi:hypothetical protein
VQLYTSPHIELVGGLTGTIRRCHAGEV